MFEKQFVHPMPLKCRHGHVQVKPVHTEECPAGHVHEQFSCPMRLGSRRCGHATVVPSWSADCEYNPEANSDGSMPGYAPGS